MVGYAQLDPLVIYKKESYSKYQALNALINQSTVHILANTDFNQIAQNIKAQQEQLQLIQTQQENNDILDKLKSATQDIPKTPIAQPVVQTQSTPTQTMSESSDFEIIELDNTPRETKTIRNVGKLRPNDKVNVRYQDGRMEFDVKYKKVADDLKNGTAELI